MSSKIQTILSANDPKSLAFDPVTSHFINVPEHLDSFLDQPPLPDESVQPIVPYLKMVPKLNADKTQVTPAGLEIINSQYNALTFISEQTFTHGVHTFELIHLMNYKNVKVGICRERKNNSKLEYFVNLDKAKNCSSVILKIDMENHKLSLILKHISYKREIKFKGANFHFFITINNIGNFISINPFYLSKGVSNVWRFHSNLLETKQYKLLRDWCFLLGFKPENFGSLEEFIKTEFKISDTGTTKIKAHIFDPDIEIMAIEIGKHMFKGISAANKNLTFAKKLKLKEAINIIFKENAAATNEPSQRLAEFIQRHKAQLLRKNAVQPLDEFLSKLKQLQPTMIKKTLEPKTHNISIKYLENSDVVFVSNGHNKIKILKQRAADGSFIVSPFLFDHTRVTTNLTIAEFQLLFKSVNWTEIVQQLPLIDDEVEQLQSLFAELTSGQNILTDEQCVFLALTPKSQQVLVEKAFEYVNLVLKAGEQISDKDEDLIIETINEDGAEEEQKPLVGNEEDHGLGELFQEPGEQQKQRLRKSSLKQKIQTIFKNNFDIFPSEFDGLLKALYRLEESLYLQSAEYRKAFIATSRSHTSFNRLFSYLYSGLDLKLIEKLVDNGVYISSAFIQEFKHYVYEDHAFGDFNDQNTGHLFLQAYDNGRANPHLGPPPNHNIELPFSVSHFPPTILFTSIEKIFFPNTGKLVLVLTTDKVLHLFAARYGLIKIGEIKLLSGVDWTSKKLFDSLIPVSTQGNEYFTQDNLADLKKKGEEAKVAKPQEPESAELVNKLMLDQLYQMGFSIELAKKALVEVKSASLDAALNIIFKLSEQEVKPAEKAKTKSFQLLLKPEWQCKVCTYFNNIDNIPNSPNTCEMCGNIADEDAYFEETQEIIEEASSSPDKPAEAANRISVVLADEILDAQIVELEKENLLHHLFICLLVRQESKHKLIVSRLAFTEEFLQHSVVVDPKSGNILSVFGQYLLKKGRKEKDLGELIQNFYVDKILNIAPRLAGRSIFTESAREELVVEGLEAPKQLSVSRGAHATERNSEVHTLFVVSDQAIQELLVTNKAKTYNQADFELSKGQTKSFDGILKLVAAEQGTFVITHKGIDYLKNQTNEQSNLYLADTQQIGSLVRLSSFELFVKRGETGEVLKLDQLADKIIPKNLSYFIDKQSKESKATQSAGFVSPKVMLSYFKAQTSLPFSLFDIKNLYLLSGNKASGRYEYFLQTLDQQVASKLSLQTDNVTKGLNVCIEAYYRVAKNNEPVRQFISASHTFTDQRSTNYHTNNYHKLHLRAVSFKGAHFSKNYHLSQMLLDNGEHFSTQYANNLFIFENLFERVMKIKQFVFIIPESFKQNSTVEEVLVFVFDDLALANIFARYKYLTFPQYQQGLKTGLFPRGAEPCLCINLKQKTESAEVKAELEIERVGRYVAFLPLVHGKSIFNPSNQVFDCFQYFGVEGEYLTQAEEAEYLDYFGSGLKEVQQPFVFNTPDWRLCHSDDKQLAINSFSIQNVSEHRNDILVKAVANASIAGEALNRLDIELPSSVEGVQLVSFSIRLLNISNSLSIEIRDQFKRGVSEKFKHFLALYNNQIVDENSQQKQGNASSATTNKRIDVVTSAESEVEFVGLGELLTFALDTFGEHVATATVQTLNLKRLIQKTVLGACNGKMLSLYRLLLEKLINYESIHELLVATMCSMLNDLDSNILTVDGLNVLWQLFHKLGSQASDNNKAKIFLAVVQYSKQALDKIQANNNDTVKLLRTFDFSDTVDGVLPFRSAELNSGKQATPDSNTPKAKEEPFTDFINPEKRIDYSGFYLQEKNYAEYYINFKEVLLLDTLMFRLVSAQKLFDYALEIQYYCHYTNRFHLIKSKRLNEDFMNHVISSAKRETEKNELDEFNFGLNFTHITYPVKLIKLVLKANYLPIYEYREPENIVVETFAYGKKVVDLVRHFVDEKEANNAFEEASKCIAELTSATNLYYSNTFDELILNNNLKPKISEIESASIYKPLNQAGIKSDRPAEIQDESSSPQQAPSELVTVLEDVNKQKMAISEYLNNLHLVDTKNLSKIKAHVSGLITNYSKSFEVVEQDRRARTLDNLKYDQNLSFWICNIDYILKEFFGSGSEYAEKIKSVLDADQLPNFIFTLFYEVYLLDNSKYGRIEDIIAELSAGLTDVQTEKLTNLIIDKFLSESPIVFAINGDRLIEKLRMTKLLNTFKWREILKQLEQNLIDRFDSKNADETVFRKILLYTQILYATLSEEKAIVANDFDPLLSFLIWLLQNHMPEVLKRFRETAVLLINKVFQLLSPTAEVESDISSLVLQQLVLLVIRNDMIPVIDKTLTEFQKAVSAKNKPLPHPEQDRRLLEKMHKTLIALVREEVIEKENGPLTQEGRIQNVLFFTLSHIKSINDLLYHSNKEGETDKPQQLAISKSISKKESIKKKDSQNLPSNHILVNAARDNDAVFNDFVADILAFIHRKQIKDNSVVSIITNFAISEHINQTVLFSFLRFAMSQASDLRQTIINDLSNRFSDIFKLGKSWSKTQLRDFATIAIELLIFIMANYSRELIEDVTLVHFCIKLTLQVINENEPKVVADEPCKIALKSQVVTPLFFEAFKLLINNFNYGGVENFQFFGQDKLNLFEFVSYCVHILVKGLDESGTPLLNYLIQNFKSLREANSDYDLSAAIEWLCIWLLCNVSSTSPDLKSIVGPLFKKLYVDVDFLYFELMKKEECAKLLLNYTCQHFRVLYKLLYRKLQGESLGYLALNLAENTVEFMENLLKNVAKNEILSAYFLNHIKGLEMIFNILNEVSSTAAKVSPNIHEVAPTGLFAALKAISDTKPQAASSPDTGKVVHSTNKDKAIFDEEFGNRIKNIYIDKTITNGNNIKDWHVNKTGRNASIYSTAIQSNKKSITLRFKSTEPFELRNFKLGLTVTRSENYVVVGPSPYVHLYAILEDDQKSGGSSRRIYLGELERLEDSGYLIFNSMAYVLNPNRLHGPLYANALDNIKYVREVTDFEVVIARPLFTVVDKVSPLCAKSMTAVNISINFISIDGFSHSKVDLLASFRAKTQTTLNSLIDVVFNSESFVNPLDEYFDALNKQGNTELYGMIESQLDPIMQNFDEKMSKFLMILSEKNKQMADSIFVFLMKNIQKKLLFFDLIEKILKRTYSYKYLFEFFDFGKRKLCGSAEEATQFLKVVTNYVVHLAHKLDDEEQRGRFVVPIDQKFYKLVLGFHKVKPFTYSIERFLAIIVTFLYNGRLFTEFPPEVARLSSYHLGKYTMSQNTRDLALSWIDLIVQAIIQNEFVFLPLLTYIALECAEAKQSIVDKKFIALALQNILKDGKFIRTEVLLFIQAIVEFDDLYEIALKEQADKLLLSTLETQLSNHDFKTDEEQIHLLLKTIFKVFKISRERTLELEETLFALLKNHKSEPFFIEKIFLKFFEFEMTKAVSFKVVKKSTIEGAESKIENEAASQTVGPSQKRIKLASNFLNLEGINKLASKLMFLVDEKTDKEIRRHDWKKVLETSDTSEDFSAKFEMTCFNKKPLLIIASTECNGLAGSLGLFAPEGFTECTDQPDYNAYISNSDNVFLFYYTEGTELHYKPDLEYCSKFLQYTSNPDNKTISLSYDMSEKVLISMMPDVVSNVDLSPMKPIAQDNNPDFEFPYDVHINCIEIFQLDVKTDQKSLKNELDDADDLCFKYLSRHSVVNLPYSLYSSSIVYDLQSELTLKALKDAVPLLIPLKENKEKKLGDIATKHVVLEVSREVPPLSKKSFENNYNPKFPIFETFVERGGMKYVIETIKQNDKITYLAQNNLNEIWRKLMDDLLDLEKIEGFLSSMIQNKEFLLIIFELFIGGQKSDRNWQDAEFLVSSLIFEKLASILKNTDSIETRKIFFEKNVLRKLLDKLSFLTSETSRVYDDIPDKPQTTLAESQTLLKEESLIKEVKKRKGVGYDKEGSGKKWLVNEYLAKKKLKNEFVVHLLKLFKNLFSVTYEEHSPNDDFRFVKESWFNTIAESCLLPLLESAFKSSSLHEMAKEYEVYEQYCQVLLTISTVPQLKPLLKQLPSTYKPVQLESVLSILQKQEDNTRLFKKFSQVESSKPKEGEEKLHSIELANLIQDAIENVKSHYPEYFDEGEGGYEEISNEDVDRILHLPVNEQYKIAFKDLKFDLVDMKKANDTNCDHHYASNIASDPKVSSQARMVRLAQEIADLTSSLPTDSYNAITVRADTNRLDVIKSMIAGAEGTPYANGLFEYHVYLPSEYPSGPPKCNLETTGSGDVRFNPNLYSCGKVCLSLLGTWRGSASENWDPKISNLLQLFLSIQSVVMSEEVYFNEPGYEGESGTEEGEKKNEGYSNIVRLCNIKFAMIRHIKTPVKGFEEVTRRHFYIKRDVILNECARWVKMAEVRPCTYGGLVSDHNHKYSSRFSSNNKAYLTDLKAAITDLENTLKELVASNNPHTIFASKRHSHGKAKTKRAAKEKPKKDGEVMDLQTLREKIDTTWEENVSNKVFDAEDQTVSDRWSRYIGAMGIEAVKKQAQAKVAIIGINALGLEIAKNIVLSGVNTLALCDWRDVAETDLLGMFYASPEDVGKNRSEVVKRKIEQLNFYVKVEAIKLSDEQAAGELAARFDFFIICDNYSKFTRTLVEKAQEAQKKLIVAENVGVFVRVFNDFGKQFIVNDRDGEDPAECYIKSIDTATNRIILFDKSQNLLRNDDYIVLDEIESPAEDQDNSALKPLNASIHKIKEMHKVTEIEVEDLSGFKGFLRNGKIKELKVPIKHDFVNYTELNTTNFGTYWDENLRHHDFLKYESSEMVAKCFLIKESFEKDNASEFGLTNFEEIQKALPTEVLEDEKLLAKLKLFWLNCKGRVHSIDAFVGGVVSQEAIKSITGKFTPIKQLFCTEFEEILDESLLKTPDQLTEEVFSGLIKKHGKYGPLAMLIGEDSFEKLRQSQIFMVGSGAIGCELLKNYAMIGLGSGDKGRITLTDPDSIELSNLNRQFLFREKHISKPKSIVAASVIEAMNPDYIGKINARLEKVSEETENVFNDEFFGSTAMCFNALDNVKARIYMDQRCVRNHVPLLESGTLGPKGHVQVILPQKTENYTQVRDANDEQNIPVCTLKMFPEEPVHCMEWAKDRFEVFFAQNPRSCIRVLEEFAKTQSIADVDFKIQKSVLKFLERRPSNMNDAINLGLKYYYKAFHNKIRQLLHVYPLDFVTKDGKLFWTLPKRPPVALEFSLEDDFDIRFLRSFTKLQTRVWSIEESFPEPQKLADIIKEIKIEPFKPKDSAIESIKQAVATQNNPALDQDKEQEKDPLVEKKKLEEQQQTTQRLEALLKEADVDKLVKKIKIEVFEKDNDHNGHVDFIHAMTNERNRNYKLPLMEWIQVKLKAGRIVPALATTTSAIAALQTIEAIKVVKQLAIEQFRNAFVNLAIPTMTLSEPGPAAKYKIHSDLEVTVWDQWQYAFKEKEGNSLKDLFGYLKNTYKVIPCDLLKGNKPIFFSTIDKYEDFAEKALDDLVDIEKGEYCYVNVICKLKPEDEQPLQNIPQLKITYN